jgi:hypothetical protein
LLATATTSGATPIEFDAGAPGGDPEIGSTAGSTALGSLSAPRLAQGTWDIAPDVIGPYGPTGATPEPVTTSMAAVANQFDPAVSSQTGDMWQASVRPSVLTGFSPVVIGPGQTGTIPITITPRGARGTHVAGDLYVDTADEFIYQNYVDFSGSEVAALPYRYTVK